MSAKTRLRDALSSIDDAKRRLKRVHGELTADDAMRAKHKLLTVTTTVQQTGAIRYRDPRTIMETLGHSQISLTLNTYSHVMPALQQAAAEKIDAVLGGR